MRPPRNRPASDQPPAFADAARHPVWTTLDRDREIVRAHGLAELLEPRAVVGAGLVAEQLVDLVDAQPAEAGIRGLHVHQVPGVLVGRDVAGLLAAVPVAESRMDRPVLEADLDPVPVSPAAASV